MLSELENYKHLTVFMAGERTWSVNSFVTFWRTTFAYLGLVLLPTLPWLRTFPSVECQPSPPAVMQQMRVINALSFRPLVHWARVPHPRSTRMCPQLSQGLWVLRRATLPLPRVAQRRGGSPDLTLCMYCSVRCSIPTALFFGACTYNSVCIKFICIVYKIIWSSIVESTHIRKAKTIESYESKFRIKI